MGDGDADGDGKGKGKWIACRGGGLVEEMVKELAGSVRLYYYFSDVEHRGDSRC
jgi:hypothetical protein